MKRKVVKIIGCFVVILSVVAFQGLINAGTESPGYGFQVLIQPEQNHPDIFTARFTVTNLNSSAIVAAPTVRFRAGEPAQSTSVATDGGTSFSFSVSVNDHTSVAEYEVKVLSGSSVISQSRASIAFGK